MITLYHRDTSICSQKVRLVLHEKNLEWQGAFINLGKREQLEPDYLKLNPNGVIPTQVLESTERQQHDTIMGIDQ